MQIHWSHTVANNYIYTHTCQCYNTPVPPPPVNVIAVRFDSTSVGIKFTLVELKGLGKYIVMHSQHNHWYPKEAGGWNDDSSLDIESCYYLRLTTWSRVWDHCKNFNGSWNIRCMCYAYWNHSATFQRCPWQVACLNSIAAPVSVLTSSRVGTLPSTEHQPLPSLPSNSSNTIIAIVGGVVAVVLIIAVTAIIIIVVAFVLRSHRQVQKQRWDSTIV